MGEMSFFEMFLFLVKGNGEYWWTMWSFPSLQTGEKQQQQQWETGTNNREMTRRPRRRSQRRKSKWKHEHKRKNEEEENFPFFSKRTFFFCRLVHWDQILFFTAAMYSGWSFLNFFKKKNRLGTTRVKETDERNAFKRREWEEETAVKFFFWQICIWRFIFSSVCCSWRKVKKLEGQGRARDWERRGTGQRDKGPNVFVAWAARVQVENLSRVIHAIKRGHKSNKGWRRQSWSKEVDTKISLWCCLNIIRMMMSVMANEDPTAVQDVWAVGSQQIC